MKIIKQGALPQEKVYKATCGNCSTEYEFTRAEARCSADQRDGDILITKCPLPGCGQDNWIYP
jgi:hypothetical protein